MASGLVGLLGYMLLLGCGAGLGLVVISHNHNGWQYQNSCDYTPDSVRLLYHR